MIKLSIIIPFFNTPEEYVVKCLKSIRNQKYTNYEIIIVDDGSEEVHRSFVRNLVQEDERIHFIEKSHSGVSNTRNVGIKKATGDYVAFVDADDTVVDFFVTNSINAAKKYDFPDIVIGGIEYDPYAPCNGTQFGDQEDYYLDDDIELLKKSLLHIRDKKVKYNILGSPCAKLYKRKLLLDGVLFPESISLCEDQIFNRLVLMKARSAVVVPELWYRYYQNDFSVMHTKVRTNLWDMKKEYWNELYKLDFFESNSIKDGLRGVYIRSFISLAAIYCRNRNIKSDIKREIVLEALDHQLIQLAVNSLNIKSKIPLSWKIQWIVLKLRKFALINVLAQFVD